MCRTLCRASKMMSSQKNLSFALASLLMLSAGLHGQHQLEVKLPLRSGSVRFAVIGDTGTGDKEQYEVAKKLEAYRQAVKFDFLIMLGDNICGGHIPEEFIRKLELPYKPMLDHCC